ncbi:toxin [Candidatus Pacebacteria bacterium]|nr:toxin [Candidatus Paceibacterota bacterium]
MYFEWSEEKNEHLKNQRNVSFEAVQTAIQEGGLLDIHMHPNVQKYPNQLRLVINIDDYIYLVPCIPKENEIWFLKTIIPSRKATKDYLKNTNREL